MLKVKHLESCDRLKLYERNTEIEKYVLLSHIPHLGELQAPHVKCITSFGIARPLQFVLLIYSVDLAGI
jgi:hypothetical protein